MVEFEEIKKTEEEKSFRDSVSTIDKEGKRVWIFPQKPFGKLYNLRSYFSYLCLAIFFGLPFIKIDGEPFFMLNILERKFILFGAIFWPQDFILFGLAMLTFVIFIALFTVIYGRVFCGWACPQTIFLEMVFRKIEYFIEGDANQQRKLKNQEWNTDKIVKKTSKHLIFFAISFLIANTFLAYIIGIDELKNLVTGKFFDHISSFISLVIFSGVFYGVFSHFREQVCLVVCPYGRLQGVLLDKDSIVVAYDYKRGEPRGHFKRNETRTIGDCVDCSLCVKVCPTGIDIRNGTQLECVNCTACIDACNSVMEKTGLPKDLIRYDSENGISKGTGFSFTNRMKAYSLVLVGLATALVFLLTTRSPIEATVLRVPGMLFQEQVPGKISNLYNIKMVNKTRKYIDVQLKLEGIEGEIKVVGKDVHAKEEAVSSGTFFIIIDKEKLTKRKTKINILVLDKKTGEEIEDVKTTFLGPLKF